MLLYNGDEDGVGTVAYAVSVNVTADSDLGPGVNSVVWSDALTQRLLLRLQLKQMFCK